MFGALILTADVANGGGLRILLFVLLVVAILLILVGAIIAIITMYSYWKMRAAKAENMPGE